MCCPRFHLLKPEYIHGRIRELQRAYTLRLLLCFVDIEDVVLPLGQIIKAALLNHMTLVCAWSPQVTYLCMFCQELDCGVGVLLGGFGAVG